jgi:hypothetical protein
LRPFHQSSVNARAIVDAGARRVDWLDKASLSLGCFVGTQAITLLDADRPGETRFALGERYLALERLFQLPALLEMISTALPDVPPTTLAGFADRGGDQCDRAGLRPIRSRSSRVTQWRFHSHLRRWFHAHTGCSPSAHPTRVRVHAARHLLQHTTPELMSLRHELASMTRRTCLAPSSASRAGALDGIGLDPSRFMTPLATNRRAATAAR